MEIAGKEIDAWKDFPSQWDEETKKRIAKSILWHQQFASTGIPAGFANPYKGVSFLASYADDILPLTKREMDNDEKAAIRLMHNDGLTPADMHYLLACADTEDENPVTFYFEYLKGIERIEEVIASLKTKKRK